MACFRTTWRLRVRGNTRQVLIGSIKICEAQKGAFSETERAQAGVFCKQKADTGNVIVI